MALSPDGHYLAHTPRSNSELALTELSDPAPKHIRTIADYDKIGGILWLEFSPNGRHLAYSSAAGVAVLKVPTLETVWQWNAPGSVDWVEWAADSRHLITHNGNKTVYVLRLNQLAPTASPPNAATHLTANPQSQTPNLTATQSAWDALDPTAIPESERVPGQPQELVVTLGTHRQRHWNGVYGAAIRADGQQAATCSYDGIRFWNLQTFQEQAHLKSTNTPGLPLGNPLSLLYTPDGQTLLVGHGLGTQFTPIEPTISEIDVSVLPPRLVRSLKLPKGWDGDTILSEAISSGRFLSGWFIGGRGFMVERTETALEAVADFPDAGRISFAPDEKTVSVATRDDGPVRLFDFLDNKLTEKAVLTGSVNGSEQPQAPFRDAKFSPDGRLLVVDGKRIPWFWDVRGTEPKLLFKLDYASHQPRFSKDGRSLLLNSFDANDRPLFWSLNQDQAKLVYSPDKGFPRHWSIIPDDFIFTSDLSLDGKLAIIGHSNGIVRFLDVSSSDVAELHAVQPNPVVVGNSFIQPLRLGTDAFTIQSEELSGVLAWRLKDRQLQRVSMVETGFGRPLATSTDGSLLVTFESQPPRCVIRRREQNEWRAIRTVSSTIDAVSGALSRDQRRLVIGSNVGEIELWDLEAKPPRKLWTQRTPQNQALFRLVFAMSDRLLVSRLLLNVVVQRIGDTGLEPVLTLPMVTYQRILDVAPNGESFAVTSISGVAVWSLKDDPPQLVNTLSSLPDVSPRSLNYSPDGRRLAVAYSNGQILLHDLEAG